MRQATLYLSFLICLTACNDQGNAPAVNGGPDTVASRGLVDSTAKTKLHPVLPYMFPVSMGCYYKLDDKYSESEDTAAINSWWQKKLQGIVSSGFQNSLFADQGGGPNGAEWNASTDLYIAATLDQVPQAAPIRLLLNNKQVHGIRFFSYIPGNTSGAIIYCRLPKAVWEKQLRKITPADFDGIYEKENVESLRQSSVAPLETGKVLEISLHIQAGKRSYELTDFFHIAYGE
jgi:hypothetical protein